MAGYSGTALHKKLGFASGMQVLQLAMPADVRAMIESGAGPIEWTARRADFSAAHLFVKKYSVLEKQLTAIRGSLPPAGFVWVSWPKRSSGIESDITEDRVRDLALSLRLVDVKVCAVTEVWSGLKLVIPIKYRPAT